MADAATVHLTEKNFDEALAQHAGVLMVDFWAEWCAPCRAFAPVLEDLARESAGAVVLAKVNVDENPGLSQAFRIQSIPNLMVVKEKTIVFNQPGALPEASMRDLIQQAIALKLPPREPQAEPEQEQSAE